MNRRPSGGGNLGNKISFICRDDAWDAIQNEIERLRISYEAKVHRNNAVIEGEGIRIVKALSPGEEILLTKGFDYYWK